MLRANKAFSLMEVLVSLLILSIGILASGLMILKSLKLTQEGLYQTKATNLLQMQYEKILATGSLPNTQAWESAVESHLPQGKASINVISISKDPAESLMHMRIQWLAKAQAELECSLYKNQE